MSVQGFEALPAFTMHANPIKRSVTGRATTTAQLGMHLDFLGEWRVKLLLQSP
jgi:hypothetical protein